MLGSDEFVNASERCYNLISKWTEYEILYLSSNLSITPRANLTANRINLEWALTSWLNERDTPDTQVLIWIFSHGLGLYRHSPLFHGDEEHWELKGNLTAAEVNSDEQNEITESLTWRDSDRNGIKDTLGLDVNGDRVVVMKRGLAVMSPYFCIRQLVRKLSGTTSLNNGLKVLIIGG